MLFALFLAGISSVARADNHTQRFVVSVENVSDFTHRYLDVFNTPRRAEAPGPLLPRQTYRVDFYAEPGDYLSFATMLVQTNDYFLAPDEMGIPLYDDWGEPIYGDVGHYVKLWDNGTEADEPFGEGPNQAPRQGGPNTGPADPNNLVREVMLDEYVEPYQLIRVRIKPRKNGRFTLFLRNISHKTEFESPLAPGVVVIHNTPAPLFTEGQPDYGQGLEQISEDGNPAVLYESLRPISGVNTPLAPVAWAVHQNPDALFTPGTMASPGLEMLAEDGGPALLVEEIAVDNKGAAAIPTGGTEPGPIFGPDGSYTFEIEAAPGDHLSLASMLVQSNDWFYSLRNLPLFGGDGQPISGDQTMYVQVYDAGTEVDQEPGFGSKQAPRQRRPGAGRAENGVIEMADHPAYNDVTRVIRVTISPVE
ncbi:MAG: spondin domain-containing protein [Ardenticatenaceae bacterium]|nr:spondin domain-containing protein [Ardenticatenaceae bacterium]